MKFSAPILTILLATNILSAQPFNTVVTPSEAQPMLLGKINKDALSTAPFNQWFTENYNAYTPNSETIDELRNALPAYTITAFMGTWCGDSKREIPKLYKVLAAANFPLERLTVIAVDNQQSNYKQSPGGEEEGLNIHRVPTVIVYKNGQEVNRLVESPQASIEADLAKISSTNAYTPKYQSVRLVHEALMSQGLEKFEKNHATLIPKLKPITSNMYELNTYANVLYFSGRQDAAIAVAKLNLLLFPSEVNAQKSLARKIEQFE